MALQLSAKCALYCVLFSSLNPAGPNYPTVKLGGKFATTNRWPVLKEQCKQQSNWPIVSEREQEWQREPNPRVRVRVWGAMDPYQTSSVKR